MDAAQLSRWTRFASKGGIGKCIAQQDCVAREPDDLMFLKDDEIIVLMQLTDEEGIYLGYCEGVVGRFAATYVHFNGKLKTPIITKRSSSLSKSPRPRSLTPSRKRPPSQGSAPSTSRAPSRAEDPPRPSSTFPNPESSPIHTTGHDSLIASSTSHSSSSSSTQDPPFPPTPSDSYVEPLVREKTAVPDLDVSSHVSENDQTPLRPLTDSPRSSNSDSAPTMDTSWVNSQHSPPSSSSRTEPAPTSVDATSDCTSHVSVAMSDGAADIGWSMLQGAEDDDDDGGGSDDADERTSLDDDTVDGFPVPPNQIPTSSRATSLVLDTPRSQSTHSDYNSEDGDGASFYDNYRYSRASISSKMSKSSANAPVTVPPPIPTEIPPSVRPSLESQQSEPPSPSSHGPPPPAVRLPTRNLPPPLTLGITKSSSSHAAAPSVSTLASPLLHTGFSSPLSLSPIGSNTTASRSPLSPVFDFRGGGAASALRQKIESERSSPLSSPLPSANSQERTFEQPQQRTVIANKEEARGAQPQTPTSPSTSSSTSTSEKKKRGGPSPLVVMNPAPPPPPYTPTSPVTPSPLSPTYSPMPMPSPVVPRRISPAPAAEPGGPSKPRTSLFLPHPNAPKPSVASQGPLYWRSAPPPSNGNGLVETLRRAAAQMRVVAGANGHHVQLSTVYASTAQELLSSVGPVLIYFSTEPLTSPLPMRPSPSPPVPIPASPMRMAHTPTSPSPTVPIPVSPMRPSPSPPVPIPGSPMRMANTPSPSSPVPVPIPVSPSQGGLRPPATSNQNVIPRTNFIPKTATVRPRSRSFSGFDSPTIPAAQQQKAKSRDEASIPHVPVPALPTSSSEPRPRSNSLAARAAAHTSRIHQARQHTPSPLALSQVTATGKGQGPTSSGAAGSLPASPSCTGRAGSSPISPRHVLKPVKSEPAFRRVSPSKSSLVDQRETESPTTTVEAPPPPSIQIQISTQESQRKVSLEASTSGSSSSLGRSTSLRSKISLSALRSRSMREQQQQQLPDEGGADTVQVMDTDFELVRPALPRPRVSEDSSANGMTSGSEGRPSFLRVDSPATSLASGDTRSPVSPSMPTHLPAPSAPAPPIPSSPSPIVIPPSAVEAHRALELKWIAAMAATPSALARKNKKIRRLLVEGVPASVRYQVWAHLADSRAKRIEGIYGQLGERERVPAFGDIQRDAQECFVRDKRLAKPDGPLVSLLQSYLTMVPDIQYSRGLAFIAGQLLLQSPEEDAFWIFISLMDTHLRPYFSSNSVQLDIDASLFAKAVESVDSTTAKKLFVEMGIPPIRVCRPWFSSLFVEALPPEYFLRVWDIFLSEGVVFLFRIGLALVTCCRRAIRDMRSEADALALLERPPPFLLSSSPSALVELSSSFRIKDEDIRKQRVKLEAQVKRQTQSRLSSAVRRSSHSARGAITLPTATKS